MHFRHTISEREQLRKLLSFYFGIICAFLQLNVLYYCMTDLDFIRLSALVFATKLIDRVKDPVSEGTEMAIKLFDKLKEKEVE